MRRASDEGPIRHWPGEPVDLLVNGKPIERGDVVVLDEEAGLPVTEVLAPMGASEAAEAAQDA